jgi:hypothetical protein
MAYASVEIKGVVDRSVSHIWSIPEFQRGFVWKATQVRDLAESLWLDYPIGSLLVWNSQQPTEERIVRDAQRPTLWVVDGQQRSTALCIVFGRKPYWWESADYWAKTMKKYDIRFDSDAKVPPFFLVANAAIRKAKSDKYIPLNKLLVLDTAKEKDQQALMNLAKEIKLQGLCDGLDAMEVYARLDRVRKVRDIGPEINIRISAQNPMSYVSRYKITPAKLQQQFIDPGIVSVPMAEFENWLQNRATTLASNGNQFLDSLKNGL